MYQTLDVSLPADSMFWAICLIAFYSYFRKANLLIPSLDKFGSNKHLRKMEILTFNWGILILVRWSKVSQFKHCTLYVPILKIEHSALCPLQAYHDALTLAPDTRPTDPAFITYINCKESLFTYTKFAVKLQSTLQNAGISAQTIFQDIHFDEGEQPWHEIWCTSPTY